MHRYAHEFVDKIEFRKYNLFLRFFSSASIKYIKLKEIRKKGPRAAGKVNSVGAISIHTTLLIAKVAVPSRRDTGPIYFLH